MLTLKVKWIRTENQIVVDETTIFVQADEIQCHGIVKSLEEMKAWEEGSYFNYQVKISEDKCMDARIIEVNRENKPTVWYLASMAWILGSDGKTIERLI